jgi:hypothetical protein
MKRKNGDHYYLLMHFTAYRVLRTANCALLQHVFFPRLQHFTRGGIKDHRNDVAM